MNRLMIKYGHVLSVFALFMTTIACNRNCTFLLHEPKLPKSAKELRKF